MGGWEFATIYETVADHVPEAIAQRRGAHATSFRDFDRRADGVAAWLLSLGVAEQDRFAQFLFNGPEYLESVFAAYKVGLVPVNTNYRYGADEIGYLWDNAEPAAVVFHGSLTPVVETVRHRLASVRGWLFVDDAATDCPDWATPYETVATTPAPRQRAPWGRDGDQLCLLYTGGTTGLPKGVMWRQDDVAVVMPSLGPFSFGSEPDYDALASTLGSGQQLLAACPLMHGTALFTSHAVLAQGGSVATLASRRFDALELLDDVARHRVAAVILVGDAFARPILEALEASPGRWDLSSLTAIGSSGAMWSEPVKLGLLAHHPTMLLLDSYGSSEALPIATSISGVGAIASTATFAPSEAALVLGDDGRAVAPGSTQVGVVAVGGRVPLGYFRDDTRSAATFRVIDGRRVVVLGDLATVAADGTITLLGRGSSCINTGGEKVYAEEVEEVLKTHADVVDAVVVGSADERWGEVVTALVQARPGTAPRLDELAGHVKGQLAGYKAPRRLVLVERVGRAPNGKVDYQWAHAVARERLAAGVQGAGSIPRQSVDTAGTSRTA